MLAATVGSWAGATSVRSLFPRCGFSKASRLGVFQVPLGPHAPADGDRGFRGGRAALGGAGEWLTVSRLSDGLQGSGSRSASGSRRLSIPRQAPWASSS